MVWEKKPAFLLLQVLQSQKKHFFFCPLFFLHLSPSTVVDIGWGLAVNQRRKPGCTFWNTNIGVLCTFWSVNFGVLWYFAPFEVLYSFICCHLTFYCRTREVEAFSFGRRIFFNIWQMAHGWLVRSKSWILWVHKISISSLWYFFVSSWSCDYRVHKTIN